MMVMYTEDYIMRLISQAVAVLTYVVGLSKAGQHDEAITAIDEGLEELLGLRADLVRQLDDREILHMLMVGGTMDYGRAMILAELFSISAESSKAIGHPEKSTPEYQRALVLYLEVALNESSELNVDLAQKVVFLHHELEGTTLSVEIELSLLDFYEQLLTKYDEFITSAGCTRLDAQNQVDKLTQGLQRYLDRGGMES